jgi:hypothetical protein
MSIRAGSLVGKLERRGTSASVACLALPSTITSASRLPATTRSIPDSASWELGGFTMSSPSIFPTRTAPIGPRKGRSETASAAEAPIKAGMSGWVMPSAASTVARIWVSSRKPSAKSGRMERSMKRETMISRSASRPSRLKKPPGILPAAEVFSTKSTVRGKKSIPSRGVPEVAATSTTVSP